MCGIIGIVGKTEVATALYDALTVLQHRGQDAAGIATYDGTRLHMRRGPGLVRDVFSERDMQELKGRAGIGHCRYPTAGAEDFEEAQPFYVNSPYGIAFAHNGNLINTESLRREMFENDRRHINTDSDSEILLNILAHELQIQERHALTPDEMFKAVAGVHARAKGGYACVALVLGYGLLAFRDPHGIRPLVLGERVTPEGKEYACASESVAFDILGFRRVRDVAPGEAVFISFDGKVTSRRCAEGAVHAPCIFEYVYLARPDSMIEDVSVYKARLRMGEKLAEKILRERPDHDIDAVIPIPDTSRTARFDIGRRTGRAVPRGLRQEPLHRPHLHHAGTGRARAVRCAASSTRFRWSSATRTCCWWTIRSCAARHRGRSCRWRARPVPTRSTSPRPRRRCAIRTCTASTCRRRPNWWRTGAASRTSARPSVPTG